MSRDNDSQEKQSKIEQGQVERLFNDDPDAGRRILAIDLHAYDVLVTYPAGINWKRERAKVKFLQTALRLEVPWDLILSCTSGYFGQELNSPPIPAVIPYQPGPFTLPPFDIARQTTESWARLADKSWAVYRGQVLGEIRNWKEQLLKSGELVAIKPKRHSSKTQGQRKTPIADEDDVFRWAVVTFFSVFLRVDLPWADLASYFPDPVAPKSPAPAAAKSKRRRAEQIRTRVIELLTFLGLPLPELPE